MQWRLELYIALIFSFGSAVIIAQGSGGMVSLHPEEDHFVSIHLQTHKGLPRFGVLDNYVSQGTRATRSSSTPEIREKTKKVRTGLSNYFLMTQLKYLAPLMGDLDKERLTPVSGNTSQAQRNSVFLQRFIRTRLASSICLAEACQKLGKGKNEFERLRNYKAFTSQFLQPLQEWSQTFFKDDQLTVYHVSSVSLGRQYDFDRKGYWINHGFGMNSAFSMGNSRHIRIVFEPKTPYENNIKNKLGRGNTLQFLLKMNEETAERYQTEGVTRLYLVKKIRIQHGGKTIENATHPITFNYAHLDPVLEIYEDLALTTLLSTLSLDHLILKRL
ncbi:MAG: hypothetical protein AAGF96_11485 [Bacteroidota bacterium]